MVNNLNQFAFACYFAYARINSFCTRPHVTLADAIKLAIKVTGDILAGISVWNLIFWWVHHHHHMHSTHYPPFTNHHYRVPTFVLDFALHGVVSTDVLGYINLGVNLT